MNDPKTGTWSAPESPITIEYSLVVIEEIRHEVAQGFQRLSRGGIEVGGVLYGIRDGRTVKIQAIRPIECEHSRGPAFHLSDKDKAELVAQMAADDPRLEGLIAVGWFLSHTRSEISLSDSDLEIYGTYFPAPWQVTMVIRPGRAGSMRAGFFIREADGTVKSDASYLEFNFPDRLAGVLDRPPRSDRPQDRPAVERRAARLETAVVAPGPIAVPREQPVSSFPAPEFLSSVRPQPRKLWPWIVLVIALLAGGGWYFLRDSGLTNLLPGTTAEPMGLSVLEKEGQLQIEWNHQSRVVTGAVKGKLEIIDGGEPKTIALSPADLAVGKFTMERKTGDIEVRMSVENSTGKSTQEASRYLGRAPQKVDPKEVEDLRKKRADLEAEIVALKEDNDRQAARIQQLERTLRILQARPGIDAGKQDAGKQ